MGPSPVSSESNYRQQKNPYPSSVWTCLTCISITNLHVCDRCKCYAPIQNIIMAAGKPSYDKLAHWFSWCSRTDKLMYLSNDPWSPTFQERQKPRMGLKEPDPPPWTNVQPYCLAGAQLCRNSLLCKLIHVLRSRRYYWTKYQHTSSLYNPAQAGKSQATSVNKWSRDICETGLVLTGPNLKSNTVFYNGRSTVYPGMHPTNAKRHKVTNIHEDDKLESHQTRMFTTIMHLNCKTMALSQPIVMAPVYRPQYKADWDGCIQLLP